MTLKGASGSKFQWVGAAFLTALVCVATASIVSARASEGELEEPEGRVLLKIEGRLDHTNSAQAALFDRAMLEDLPAAVLETETVVTDGLQRFDGFYMRDLLERVGADGDTVTATALNDYVIDIPATDFERFDVVVATHMNGERLEPRNKGPLWIVYPRDDHAELQDLRYDYRWVWQLRHLEIR